MTIIFLRHGEAEHNLPGWSGGINNSQAQLTPTGQQAIVAVSKELERFQFKAAYVSPMLRAQQTAKLVLDRQKSPPKLAIDNRLADVYITNKLNKHWRRWQRLWRLRLKLLPKGQRSQQLAQHLLAGGQTLGQTVTPIADFLVDIRRKNKTGPLLVVAHLHTFWAITSQLEGESLTGILETDNFLAPAGWREIEI